MFVHQLNKIVGKIKQKLVFINFGFTIIKLLHQIIDEKIKITKLHNLFSLHLIYLLYQNFQEKSIISYISITQRRRVEAVRWRQLLGFDNADQRFYCDGVGGHNYVRDSCFGLATPAGESVKPVEYHYVFSLFLSSPVFDNLWMQLLFLLLLPCSFNYLGPVRT